jgi:hypothetical protein
MMNSSPLLINEPPLQVLPTLALRVGLNEAIVLQQIHYWLNPRFNKNAMDGRLWIHNTYGQWQKQFPFWSIKTIQRVLSHLEELGLLMTFIGKDFQKAKSYTLNYEGLNNSQPAETGIRGSYDQDQRGGFTVSTICPDGRGQVVQGTGQRLAQPEPEHGGRWIQQPMNKRLTTNSRMSGLIRVLT